MRESVPGWGICAGEVCPARHARALADGAAEFTRPCSRHRRSALRNVDGDVDVVGRVGHDKRTTDAQEIVERPGAFRHEV